jgi:hypothetical protein
VTLSALGHSLRRAGSHQLPTAIAAFWAEINDPVRGFNDVKIVLNDD